MARPYKLKELEFESALTGVLEDVYDLAVRSSRERLERRGCAVLEFAYEYGSRDSEVKVVVSIEGPQEASFSIPADFSDSWTIAESADPSDDLAWAVQQRLEEIGGGVSPMMRRWDD